MNWRANVPSLKQFRVVTDLRGAKEQKSKEGSTCISTATVSEELFLTFDFDLFT